MANTVIQLKYSTSSGNTPPSLANGELAINNFDGKLFYRDPSGTIQTIQRFTGPAGLNKEIQFNDAGILGSNSGLTFDKTTGLLTLPKLNVTSTSTFTGASSFKGDVTIDNASGAGGSDEGGQINFATATANSTLSGPIAIDIYQNKVRIFETTGTNRGVYIDLTSAGTGVGTNLLAAGGGGGNVTSVAGATGVVSNNQILLGIQSISSINNITFDYVATSNNGFGQNFKVGDDAWIGDTNIANTIRIKGQQDAANGYIIFGNNDGVLLGRAGSGPLTYGANTVWHAGNDGAGSGLDADLLDGLNSTSFANSIFAQAAFDKANNALPNTGSTIVVNSASVFSITNTSTSTSNTTGALVVGGGLGVKGNVYADAIYDGGIEVLAFANTAYNQANTGTTIAQAAYNFANTINTKTDSAYAFANTVNTKVDSSYAFANTVNTKVDSAYAFANTVNVFTQSAYNQANVGSTIAQAAYNQANTATTTGQAAFDKANTATTIAQAAFDNSNTKFSSSGGTISGSVTVTGNLTVSGNVVTLSANNLSLKDNMIYLNDGANIAYPDLGVVGAYDNGVYQHTGVFRDQSDGVWKFFDGYLPEPDASVYIDTSNTSFRLAPLSVSAITVTTSNVGTVLSGTWNGTSISTTYTDAKITSVGGQTGAISNTQLLDFIEAVDGAGSGLDADLLDGLQGSSYANSVFTQAAFDKANTATTTGQAAFDQSNTATTTGQAAYNQANTATTTAQAAFDKANTDVTNISTSAGTYGNASIVPVVTLLANGRVSSITNTTITIDASQIGSGTLPISRGGTNQTSFTNGQRLFFNGTSLASLANVTTTVTGGLSAANTITSFTVDAYGGVTAYTGAAIAIDGSQITSGNVSASRLFGSYGNITQVGTLTSLNSSGEIAGLTLRSTQSSGNEGGQIDLNVAATNTSLNTSIAIDIYQDRLRFFETGGSNRGAFINLALTAAGVGTNLMATSASTEKALIIAASDEVSNITPGTSRVTFRAPSAMTLTKAPRASLTTASNSGNVAIDINESGVSIFSTLLYIDVNEKTSTTAVNTAVLSDSTIADDAEITIDVDAAGANAKGLKITFYYT